MLPKPKESSSAEMRISPSAFASPRFLTGKPEKHNTGKATHPFAVISAQLQVPSSPLHGNVLSAQRRVV